MSLFEKLFELKKNACPDGDCKDDCFHCETVNDVVDEATKIVAREKNRIRKIAYDRIDRAAWEIMERYRKDQVIPSDPEDFIHKGLNPNEFASHLKKDVAKALTKSIDDIMSLL